MTIASGTPFNSYLIGESIGAGGMGEIIVVEHFLDELRRLAPTR